MSELDESIRINKYLSQFGSNLYTLPIFRLVWSTDQLEKRYGTFSEYAGSLFLREVTAFREVPKYWYIPDRWMLERWFPPEIAYNEEVPDSRNGSYEPLYVFDKGGKILPLNLRVIELIMNSIYNLSHSSMAIKSRQLAKDEQKEKLEQEYFDANIGGGSSLELQLHWGEAILVPSNYNIDATDDNKEKRLE